jgi:hypothetical protein
VEWNVSPFYSILYAFICDFNSKHLSEPPVWGAGVKTAPQIEDAVSMSPYKGANARASDYLRLPMKML